MQERNSIAIGVGTEGKIWPGHFGMSPFYYIYDRQGNLLEKRPNPYAKLKHHDNPRLIVDLLPECSIFIARRMGQESKQTLIKNLGIEAITTSEEMPETALKDYLATKNL